ncbi:cupredoxin domain-containing protein [Streptomyces europaeiscabiei]|nr:cupredoxin domain-containing protein [Streptomyces europaeiscabiei]
MGAVDIVVVLASAVMVAVLGWYFFGPRRAGAARLEGGVQRVEVTVRGGYRPDVIKVRQGTPVELVFDRQEAGECTSRVVFPDLKVGAGLPAHTRTTVREEPGPAGLLRLRLRHEHDPRHVARRTRGRHRTTRRERRRRHGRAS